MNQIYHLNNYIIEKYEVGSFGVNNYLVYHPETRHAILIDAGDDLKPVIARIEQESLKVSHLINTHGHLDHIFGNQEIKERYNTNICIHEAEAEALTDPKVNLSVFMGLHVVSPPADILLKDNQTLQIEELELKIIHAPGHSAGGIAILCENYLFCGDIIFYGSIGRTDFPGGDYQGLISNIKSRILTLDDHIILFPGHGPETTIGEERRSNPYLQDEA
ncbi:MAG: MBL fold metallo-hydrolase [Calditrichia bacterium]